MSGNAVEELGMGLGNGNEVGDMRMCMRSGTGVGAWGLEMGLRLGNGFVKSGQHEVGEWEWGCGVEMELKTWIGIVEYTGAELGSGNRAVEWGLEGWGVGTGLGVGIGLWNGNLVGEWE